MVRSESHRGEVTLHAWEDLRMTLVTIHFGRKTALSSVSKPEQSNKNSNVHNKIYHLMNVGTQAPYMDGATVIKS